jgi:hypothetical protein
MVADRQPISCYQSCWTATSAEHRGKKVFQNLMNAAKDILRSRGGAFIFGFGNFNSQPILKNKLGFRETDSLKWQVPNIPFLKEYYVGNAAGYPVNNGAISQNDDQLIDCKRKTYGNELTVVQYENSFVWGVTRKRKKAGIQLKFFEIGGVHLDKAADLQPLFAKLWQQVRDVSYYQLAITSNNSFTDCFNNLKPAQTNDLIVFDLNLDTTGFRFNFFGGVKDVY